MDLQHVPFLQRIHENFSEIEAHVIGRAYASVIKYVGTPAAQYLRPAEILLEYDADASVILSALLAPLRQAGYITLEYISTHFGELPADLVKNVDFETTLRIDTEEHRHEDVQTLLTSFTDDLRVVVLRLGLRLATLEHLVLGNSSDQREIAQETLELYVPLADRMGLGKLRARIEDVSFRLLEPSLYAELERKLNPILAEDALYLELLKEAIQQLLTRNSVQGSIHGRTKSLYSLYRKMCRQQVSVEAIMDRIGLRIIVPSVLECYHVLGLLHTHFQPIPRTFDDYIGLPKANGYQALHTCIYPVSQYSLKPTEIQIRTEVMHREAEFGIAAHWRYKSQADTPVNNTRHLDWLRNLRQYHERTTTHMEFLEHLRRQVFENNLVIFGNVGQPLRLPAGATVRDFAKQIGISDLSDVVVRVNGEIKSLDDPLQDGDTVELAT